MIDTIFAKESRLEFSIKLIIVLLSINYTLNTCHISVEFLFEFKNVFEYVALSGRRKKNRERDHKTKIPLNNYKYYRFIF
jgi:hypothetical protein